VHSRLGYRHVRILHSAVGYFANAGVTNRSLPGVQDPDVPVEAEYLKVVYSAEFPALPSDLAGRSFKRVFGATQSCMELFLLKRDLMGPCWLNVKVLISSIRALTRPRLAQPRAVGG
jgi:hypothetical protein